LVVLGVTANTVLCEDLICALGARRVVVNVSEELSGLRTARFIDVYFGDRATPALVGRVRRRSPVFAVFRFQLVFQEVGFRAGCVPRSPRMNNASRYDKTVLDFG
jgi:hypothetical protein